MNQDHSLDVLIVACSRLDRLTADLAQSAKEAQAAIRKAREYEEAQLREALVAMFQEQQRRTEAALRPQLARAWQAILALTAIGGLVLGGFLLLIKQASNRADAAQARADAVELSAEALEATRHVDITSCGGRPCIRVDKNTPTWKSRRGEYVLVDGQPGKGTRGRR